MWNGFDNKYKNIESYTTFKKSIQNTYYQTKNVNAKCIGINCPILSI